MIQELDGFDPAMLELLSEEERAIFLNSMSTLVGAESFVEYINRVAPHEPPPKHVMPIIDIMQQARFKPIRVTIDIGPGHAKTTTLQRGIAWWLSPGQSPGDLCGYVSYSDSQARDKSRISKQTYLDGGGTLHGNHKTDGHWLTPQNGGLVAKGSQGGLTGKRIPGLLVYDDPYKNVDEARSHTINSKIIERFKAVAFTRLQGGSIIVLHTRWAMDDLIGYIQKNLKWDSISIATVCDTENDILGRQIGQPAWPEKYPVELCSNPDGSKKVCGHDGHLAEIRTTLGPVLWSAMYQGRPRPLGTQVFHEPARYNRKDFSWTGKRGVITIDPAATTRTSGDWSVMLVCAIEGIGINSKMWIVDCVRIQEEIPNVVKAAQRLQKQYKLMIGCEVVGAQRGVPQMLRAIDPKLRIIEIELGGKDKYTRAQPMAAAWNDGRVLVPMDAPWVDDLIYEYTRFTGNNDAHDDQVDTGAHAWNLLYRAAPKITADNYSQNSGM